MSQQEIERNLPVEVPLDSRGKNWKILLRRASRSNPDGTEEGPLKGRVI